MKTNYVLLLLLMVAVSACKKDPVASIDYNLITGERILEVSEQASISDEDIASVERLFENVTDNSLRSKYTGMIAGLHIIKDFLPAFQTLRTDPDINFQDLYAELDALLKTVTDQLPRKATLQGELEAALAGYNTEEYEFADNILQSDAHLEGSDRLTLKDYLATKYNIHPVEGKPNRFLRSEIENVDMLALTDPAGSGEGDLQTVLKAFKGLKFLHLASAKGLEFDLNHLVNLETLILDLDGTYPEKKAQTVKFEQLDGLKHLELIGSNTLGNAQSPVGKVLDLTGRHPLLETLILPNWIINQLTDLIVPDKQHLTRIDFEGPSRNFSNIKRLIIEGKEIEGYNLSFVIGSGTNREIDEVKLSGFGRETTEENPLTGLTMQGATYPTPDKIKIKKLSVSNISGRIGFVNIDFEQVLDLSGAEQVESVIFLNSNFPNNQNFTSFKFPKLKTFQFMSGNTRNGTQFSKEDINTIFTNKPDPQTLETIYLDGMSSYPTLEYLEDLFPNLTSYNQ